jgi:hypothetical protein
VSGQDWKPGREAAEKALREAGRYSAEVGDGVGDLTRTEFEIFTNTIASMLGAANSHALLAVEARLGELVEQQRIATAIAATQCGVVFYEPSEFRQVRANVRRLLGLNTDPKGGTAGE